MKRKQLKGINVLVVDDDKMNVELMNDCLVNLGAIPALADSGQSALDLLTHYTPDLILIDLSMPDMDGWELHERLIKNPTLTGIPMIALTAHAMVGDRDRVMAAGFDGYLTKPITYKTLPDSLLPYLTQTRPMPAIVVPPLGDDGSVGSDVTGSTDTLERNLTPGATTVPETPIAPPPELPTDLPTGADHDRNR